MMHRQDEALFESIAGRVTGAIDQELIEKAPPGWAGTVKAMKKHMSDDKAFALAWDGYKKGKKPHYKDSGSTTDGKDPEKKKQYQNEDIDLEEARAVKMKPGQTMTFKTIDMGNNENKGVAISMEQDGTFTAVALSKSKGGFKTFAGAKKWLEKTHGKSLTGGIVEAAGDGGARVGTGSVEVASQTDTNFIADPAAMARSIAARLGNSEMMSSDDVISVISSMYDAGDVPAAVYATAAGMARAEQEASHASAKSMNGMSAETLADSIVKGVAATGSASIKSAQKWWSTQIMDLAPDRNGGGHTIGNVTSRGKNRENDVQPYIDSMATESMDEAFECAVQEIGAGALPDSSVDGRDGYVNPAQMSGAASSHERTVDRAAAQMAIHGGTAQSLRPARPERNKAPLPGIENRIKPGQYTAEEFDGLPYEQRLRMAEAYDRMMGGALDMSQDELVDAERYKQMVAANHSSNPKGGATPVATMSGPTSGKVVVNDLDTAFEDATE